MKFGSTKPPTQLLTEKLKDKINQVFEAKVMQLIFLKARVCKKNSPVRKYLKYGNQTKERTISLSPSNEDFEEVRRIHVQNASLQKNFFFFKCNSSLRNCHQEDNSHLCHFVLIASLLPSDIFSLITMREKISLVL